MKPNFFAFDSIVYALQAGFTQIPTFLRRGWLGAAVMLLAGAFFFSNALSLTQGIADPEFADFFYRLFDSFQQFFSGAAAGQDPLASLPDEERRVIGSFFLAYGGYLVGLILLIPGIVDVYKSSAGQPTSESMVPSFGRTEWNLLIAYVLRFILMLVFILIVGGLGAALIAGAGGSDMPGLMAIPVIALVAAIIWFVVRVTLIPAHVVLTDQISFGEAFGLASGRVWKLFGTFFLFNIVLALLTFGLSYVGQGLDFLLFFGASLIVSAVVGIYQSVASLAIEGRIAGDLLGLRSDGELVQAAAEAVEDDVEEIVETAENVFEDVAEDIAADVDAAAEPAAPRSAFGEPMSRREPGFVPRRLR